MSDLLGGAGQSEVSTEQDDRRAMSEWYRIGIECGPPGVEWTYLGPIIDDQRNPWWPGGATMGFGDSSVDFSVQQSLWYGLPDTTRGCLGRFGVVGVTRDSYGSPLGGVTVKLYQTSSDLMVASVVSDPLGNYTVTTPFYPDQHYLVFYKSGSPDVFGTSVNTLVAG